MNQERETSPQRTPAQIRRELRQVRQLVAEGALNPDILMRRQTETQIFYLLSETELQRNQKPKKEKISQGSFPVILPDGEEITVKGAEKARFLNTLSQIPTEMETNVVELAVSMNGSMEWKFVKRIYALVKNSQMDMIDTQWKIVTSKKNDDRHLSVSLKRREASNELTKKNLVEIIDNQEAPPENNLDETADPTKKGEEIQLSPHEKKICELLSFGSKEKPVDPKTVVKEIWPNAPLKVALHHLSQAIGRLKQKGINVVNINPRRSGKGGAYFIREEGISKEEFVEDNIIKDSKTEQKQDDLEEPIYIPYEPTEREKRTSQEMWLLDLLVSRRLSDIRIRFEELQIELLSKDTSTSREYEVGKAPIYSGDQIRNMFHLTVTRLMQESEISGLRKLWSQSDIYIWDKLQSAIKKFGEGNVNSFINDIRKKITSAERNYYKYFPASRN